MLIRFNVENYLSINKNTEFSMIPGKVQLKEDHIFKNSKVKLMKFSAIYGANASGKSNLIKSISDSRDIIINGVSKVSRDKYFRGNILNKDKKHHLNMRL